MGLGGNNGMGPLTELALFAGAGGGLLASQHLLGHRTVCYVENNPYCIEVLKARIRDGLLDDAPQGGSLTRAIRAGWGLSLVSFVGDAWFGCDIAIPVQSSTREGTRSTPVSRCV